MKALKGESIEIWGGDQLISLTYVDDMVKGIETVISSSVTEPVELGDADRIPIYLLARKIIQITDSNSKLSLVPQSVKDERRPNLNKASLLGWKPTVDIDEGLKRTIEWFKENS
jgi:UDP-glucuronate decarboxylase